MPGPRQCVFICATQRTGSWLLAHLLGSAGVVGNPAEFFSQEDMVRLRREWDVVTDRDYVDRVLDVGTTPNGVFTTKLMWDARDGLLFRLRRLTRQYDASDLAVIQEVFPDPRFVWLRREDVVAQAVSWAKASQTGQYAAQQDATAGVVFDFDHIDGLMHLASVQAGEWRRWFAAHGLHPFELTYEELCADRVGMALRVLSYLGIEAPDKPIIAPPWLKPQSDEVNAEWIARYRAMRAAS